MSRFSTRTSGTITLCVPAYNAAEFIEETLESILAQTYCQFRCIISVDLSSDNTYETVKPYASDSRITIHRQKNRLGWAGNVNYVLNKAETKYVCLMPHDDLLDPAYLEKLLPIIEKDDRIAVVFSDLQTFGNGRNFVIRQDSVTGSKLERVSDYLNNHYNAVLFRGIVNKELVGIAIFCSSNRLNDFSEDTIWGLKMALKGNLIRHPEILYRKRYLESSYHNKWQVWSTEKKLEAWILHCKRCLEVVTEDPDLEDHNPELVKAIYNRLRQRDINLWHRAELLDHLAQVNLSITQLMNSL